MKVIDDEKLVVGELLKEYTDIEKREIEELFKTIYPSGTSFVDFVKRVLKPGK